MDSHSRNRIRCVVMVMAILLVAPSVSAGRPRQSPVRRTKQFCAFGEAISPAISPALGTYGDGPSEWFECTAKPNNNPIPEGSTGTVIAYPLDFILGDDLVLQIPFVGTFHVTTMDDEQPEEIGGELFFEIQDGTLYVDVNAERADVDAEAGIITIRRYEMGESLPRLVLVHATGMYANLHQSEPWYSTTQGVIHIAILPDVDPNDLANVQMNILAAMNDPTLILSSSEEFVHFGSYYRAPPDRR